VPVAATFESIHTGLMLLLSSSCTLFWGVAVVAEASDKAPNSSARWCLRTMEAIEDLSRLALE
jgi:hypothetical protein